MANLTPRIVQVKIHIARAPSALFLAPKAPMPFFNAFQPVMAFRKNHTASAKPHPPQPKNIRNSITILDTNDTPTDKTNCIPSIAFTLRPLKFERQLYLQLNDVISLSRVSLFFQHQQGRKARGFYKPASGISYLSARRVVGQN